MKPIAFISSKPIKCYNCGENEHYKRNCKKPVPEQMSSSGNRGNGYKRIGKRGAINIGGTYRGNRGNGHTGYQGNRGNGKTGYRGNSNFGFHPGHYRDGNYQTSPQHSQQQYVRGGHYAGTDGGEAENIYMISDRDEFTQNIGDDIIVFFIDSGCTDHLVKEKSYFDKLMMLNNPIKIAVAKSDIEAVDIGNINVVSCINGRTIKCTIKNALYVPNLRRNLLSVKRLEMFDIKIVFEKEKAQLIKEKNIIGEGCRNNLYKMSFKLIRN